MNDKTISEAEYRAMEAQKLIGGTIAGVVFDPFNESFGLLVNGADGKRLTVWVQSDPEGNGPGFLAIENAT